VRQDEGRLIRDYLAGSDAAFAILFDRHHPSLYAFAHRLSGDPQEAEDLCQSAWLEVIRSLRSYRGRGPFRAWLHAIALNLYKDGLRRSRLDLIALDDEELPAGLATDPQRELERLDAARALEAALNRLNPAHREVLILHELQGLKYREIADILDCPLGTVKSRLHHAMVALRATLQEAGVGQGLPGQGAQP